MSLTNLPGNLLTFGSVAAFPPQINVRVAPQAPWQNWCWACVGAAVQTARRQPTLPCEIAKLVYPTKRCCPQASADPATDEIQELTAVLPLAIGPHCAWGLGQIAKIGTEINAGRPVVVQYEMSGGSYHYALIIGMVGTGSNATFMLSDPIWGEQVKNFSGMANPPARYLLWVKP